MDTQVFLNIGHALLRPFTDWPIWAIVALVTSTLHLGIVADLFDKKIRWSLLPARLIWGAIFFLISGFVITTIDATPDFLFLGSAMAILAAFNLTMHVTRGIMSQHIESKKKQAASNNSSNTNSSTGSEVQSSKSSDGDGLAAIVVLLGLAAFAVCYVGWPRYAGYFAEAAFIDDAQIVQPLNDGTMQQTVLVERVTEDSVDAQIVFVTSAGDFPVDRTPVTVALMRQIETLKDRVDSLEEDPVRREYLVTVIWKIEDDGQMTVIDLKSAL